MVGISKIGGRLYLALAGPVLVIFAFAIVVHYAANRAEYLLQRTAKAHSQLEILQELAADVDRHLLDVTLSVTLDDAKLALSDFDRSLMHKLGVLDRLTEEEIDFVEEDEKDEELEELERPAELREALESLISEVNAFLAAGSRTPGDLGSEAPDLGFLEARERFQDLIIDAIEDEKEEVAEADEALSELRHHLTVSSFLVPVLAIALGLMAGLPLARSVTRRIGTLAQGVTRFRDGHLGQRVELNGDDELVLLADRINQMAARIESDQTTLENHQRSLESEVRKQTVELLGANQRLREIDENRRKFLADVSHALRTPLSVVRATIETGRREAEDNPRNAELFQRMLDAVDDVIGRVGELMSLAHTEDGRLVRRLERFELAELLDRSAATFAKLPAAPEISLDMQGDGPFIVEGDQRDIQRMIDAVLENALRVTPEGAGIAISLSGPGRGLAEIMICDQGPGIPADERDLIFERFQAGEGGGTGIGLAMAKRIAEEHGGGITLVPQKNAGTCMKILLPRLVAGGDEQ